MKAAREAKAEWMREWAKVCVKCKRTASPVAGVVPFDAAGRCYYCRSGITPPPAQPRSTVRP